MNRRIDSHFVTIPVDDQRLGNDVFHAKAGIERREWVLKNNL